MSIHISIRSAQPTNTYRRFSSIPKRGINTDFYFKGIIPATCFRSQIPQFTSYQTLKFIKILCGILYVFPSYVILLLRKALKDFLKMFRHSLIKSKLFILTSFPSKLNSLLSSEKPFSTPGDKINFSVLKLSADCSTPDCSHRQLTELRDTTGNTAY